MAITNSVRSPRPVTRYTPTQDGGGSKSSSLPTGSSSFSPNSSPSIYKGRPSGALASRAALFGSLLKPSQTAVDNMIFAAVKNPALRAAITANELPNALQALA